MFKKTAIISVFLALAVILSACSGTTSATSASKSQQITLSSLTFQDKMGLGILQLEGTSQAVTASQASILLPLWMAVKSLSTSDITSPAEMTALYQQIQDSLTSAQVQTIKNLNLTQSGLNTMIQQQRSGTGTSARSSSSSSSSSAQSRAGGAGFGGGGFTGGAGTNISAVTGQTSSSTAPITTTVKKPANGASQLNVVFASSVVTLLQKRIS
jgi:hypothetical protein